MIEIKGKYNNAKVFTDTLDSGTTSQIIELLNQKYVEGSTVRIMPDCHVGSSCVIGTSMTLNGKVCPNIVGVDIACGVLVTKIEEKCIDFNKLDKLIHNEVPSGFSIRSSVHEYAMRTGIDKLHCANNVDTTRALESIGTLGGGNHFIELNTDEHENIYIVIHSGSRHLGTEVAKYYQEQAFRSISRRDMSDVINQLKADGKSHLIEETIKKLKSEMTHISRDMAYVEGELFDMYIDDMRIMHKYADLNRKAILDVIINGMGWNISEQFCTVHNYIDTDNMILRKGAVSAQENERLIIPINMRDGSLICTGKGNPDYNYSAPHGAGRIMSRGQAREQLSLKEYEEQMSGVYTTSVCYGTIDESPMAYKPIESIIDNIADTVIVDKIIRPVYNFKAS